MQIPKDDDESVIFAVNSRPCATKTSARSKISKQKNKRAVVFYSLGKSRGCGDSLRRFVSHRSGLNVFHFVSVASAVLLTHRFTEQPFS